MPPVHVKGLLKNRLTSRGSSAPESQESVSVPLEPSAVVGAQLSCSNWSMMSDKCKAELDSERTEQAGKLTMELASD